jgi:predicted transcriptional regulator
VGSVWELIYMTAKETLQDMARQVFERLPDDATMDDLIDGLETEQAIERGLRDVREGRVVTLEEFRKRTEICLSK